jgi:hypothetical protein
LYSIDGALWSVFDDKMINTSSINRNLRHNITKPVFKILLEV